MCLLQINDISNFKSSFNKFEQSGSSFLRSKNLNKTISILKLISSKAIRSCLTLQAILSNDMHKA